MLGSAAMLGAFALGALGVVFLCGWRVLDHRADRVQMARLIALQPTDPVRFSASMVADLPAPARRYFTYAIAEGTPLFKVAILEMSGQFSLGSKALPKYQKMSASQVLAAPEGFVWKMVCGSGLGRMSGSDSGLWTRFWLGGLVPVARFGSTNDHRRAAFGRYIAEALFWTPGVYLLMDNVKWTAVSGDTFRVSVPHAGLEQSVDVTIEADGRPSKVVFPRWSNANPDGTYREQPFPIGSNLLARICQHIKALRAFACLPMWRQEIILEQTRISRSILRMSRLSAFHVRLTDEWERTALHLRYVWPHIMRSFCPREFCHSRWHCPSCHKTVPPSVYATALMWPTWI